MLTPGQENSLLRPRNASSLVIPAFNAVTVATLPIHIDTSFLLMSFFEHSSIFSSPLPSSLEVLSQPLTTQILTVRGSAIPTAREGEIPTACGGVILTARGEAYIEDSSTMGESKIRRSW